MPLSKSRILILLPTLDLGGSERQALHLASHLQDTHHAHVAIVALYGGTGTQALRTLAPHRRIPTLRLSMPTLKNNLPTFQSIRQFARELRFLQPDLLLPYTALPNLLCGLTWHLTSAKTCIWNQRDEGLDLPASPLTDTALKNTPLFIANSPTASAFLSTTHAVDPKKIQLIPNGVSLPSPKESRHTFRHRLHIPQDALLATMLANIRPLKDHATLIRAWKIVTDKLPHLFPTLLLAGKEIDSQSLHHLIHELNLQTHIRFLGPVDDVSSLLHACDLSLLTSTTEGLSNALLESMAVPLPIIATDIPANRFALGETYPHLVPAKNPELFAKAILHLVADPSHRHTLAHSLHTRALSHFSLKNMCDTTTDVLRSAIFQQ